MTAGSRSVQNYKCRFLLAYKPVKVLETLERKKVKVLVGLQYGNVDRIIIFENV